MGNKVDFKETFDRSFNKMVVKEHPLKTRQELKTLVSLFYDIQGFRLSAGNRQFQIENNETNLDKTLNISFAYTKEGLKATEELIIKWLKDYVENDPIGQWMLSIKGIGPVLAAGLLGYIDISKCNTAGSIWRYAGWEGHHPRKKGEKLTYNPNFRVLCWKIGESFQKVSGTEKEIVLDESGTPVLDDNGKPLKQDKLDSNGEPIYRSLYGELYSKKLKFYIQKNEEGGFAENAKEALSERNFSPSATKDTYESGKLPMSHMIAMAKRFAVKIFLSHLFEVWYEYENHEKPPKPFVEVQLGHAHIIRPPNKEILGLID